MIRCHLQYLKARCRERGYTLDEVRPCIVSNEGDQITVDVDHPAYPREPKPLFIPTPPPASGPGAELKKLLKTIGITSSPTCSCNKRAAIMDQRGVEWCEQNIDEIVGWLREEATKRKLPFIDFAGRTVVNLAIRRAKKGSKK